MRTWQYVAHDVWGNADDGYEVNQSFSTLMSVTLSDDPTDEELLKACEDQLEWQFGGVEIACEWHEDAVYLSRCADGRPEGEFRRVDP